MARLLLSTLCLLSALQSASLAQDTPLAATPLKARVIAVGIPGAAAIAGVGFFHPGGPINDNPAFAAFTQPGRILDRKRILVTSNSNFGAPKAQMDAAEGSVLSIDPDGPPLVVPASFAALGNQASALEGRLQLFAAQSPAFLNSVRTPGAASAAFPTVSNPIGISINNGFGRLWFSNTPNGVQAPGTESIADPGGEPLAKAPSKLVGGVFAGDLTNRASQIIPGALNAGGVASALLGMSPDGSKRAVFAVLTADGALAQAHTEFALDGLAPAGTVQPIPVPLPGEADRARLTRAGMIMNWVPDRILYITDPRRNAIVALTLTSDEKVFRVQDTRLLTPPQLSDPVDLAPVVLETANPGFSSNTTMAGNSDMYVLNRGNGTIVRLRQDGTVVAVRRVALADGQEVGPGRLNGIAVSPDAQRIWLTISGPLPEYPASPGALLEVPAFGPGRAATIEGTRLAVDVPAGSTELIERGARLFQAELAPPQGLGPLFNGSSCLECHQNPTAGGMGANGLAVVYRVGRFEGGAFDPLIGRGGPVARTRSIAGFGLPCEMATGPPPDANMISVRNAPSLYGLGLIDSIPDEVIRAGPFKGQATQGPGAQGRPHIVRDAQGSERVGRFGWKGETPTLEQFVADAFRNEMGITSPLAPNDLVERGPNCGATTDALEDDGRLASAVAAYIAALPPLAPRIGPQHREGQTLFAAVGCAACHTPTLPGRIAVPLYSDLLLHDMGPALDDGVVQGSARGKDWRTTPLWGLGSRQRFLHDGRAVNITAAILAHDGEATAAVDAFRRLTYDEKSSLVGFLSAL